VFHWLDAAALLCVGGLSLAYGMRLQQGHPPVAVFDPTYPKALEYHSK
jgi:hypothetical protein